MNAAQGKLSSLPNLPAQEPQLLWVQKSNDLYTYYHHYTPVGLCGTTVTRQLGNIFLFWAYCRCLNGEWETEKNLFGSKFALEKDKRQHVK